MLSPKLKHLLKQNEKKTYFKLCVVTVDKNNQIIESEFYIKFKLFWNKIKES